MEENQVIEPQVVETPVVEQPKEDRAANNLIIMRQKLEREEEARKQAERRAAELERHYNSQQPQQQVVPEEEENIGDPDSYIEVKQHQKATKKIHSKLTATEQRIAELENKLLMVEAQSATKQLKDFDEIVSPDNIKTLARLYPEEYESMMMHPSLASKSKMAYNMIKAYGIAESKVKDSDARIAANKSKPGNASLGAPQTPQTPLTALKDYERRVFTDEQAKAIMKRAHSLRGEAS